MPTISELIRDRRGDKSYRDLAKHAADRGLHIKFQTLNNLAIAPPKQWPKSSDSLRAIAAALDVSEQTVVLSYARSMGIDVSSSFDPSNLTNAELMTEISRRLATAERIIEEAGAGATVFDLPPQPNLLGPDAATDREPSRSISERTRQGHKPDVDEDAPMAAREGAPREHDANAGEQDN